MTVTTNKREGEREKIRCAKFEEMARVTIVLERGKRESNTIWIPFFLPYMFCVFIYCVRRRNFVRRWNVVKWFLKVRWNDDDGDDVDEGWWMSLLPTGAHTFIRTKLTYLINNNHMKWNKIVLHSVLRRAVLCMCVTLHFFLPFSIQPAYLFDKTTHTMYVLMRI